VNQLRRIGLIALGLAILGLAHLAPEITAQPPAPATATPAVTPGPPPDIGGEWSITRTWYRRCPRCGQVVIRTTPWKITQTGQDVRVDRGPRGTIAGAPLGGGYLTLEGTETDGFDVYRFWYATLRVSADGNSFEGAFNGAETIQNPCGDDPPIVTCFTSGGWIRGRRISPIGTVPPPPGPPTPPLPSPGAPTAIPTAMVTPPSPTAVPTQPPTATPTVRPLRPLFFPVTGF
jgi:hypothetical protein